MTFSGNAAVPYQHYDAGYYGAHMTPLPIIMQRPPAPVLSPYVVMNAAPVSIVKFSDGKLGQRMSEEECARLVKKFISINQNPFT
jgi:hypothetical protein